MKLNQILLECEERAAQGFSPAEISRQLDVSEDLVKRILEDMLTQQMRADPDYSDDSI